MAGPRTRGNDPCITVRVVHRAATALLAAGLVVAAAFATVAQAAGPTVLPMADSAREPQAPADIAGQQTATVPPTVEAPPLQVEPAAVVEEPATPPADPAVSAERPAPSPEEAAPSTGEPAASMEEAAPSTGEPAASMEEPATSSVEAGASLEEPAASSVEAGASLEEPAASTVQPAVSAEQRTLVELPRAPVEPSAGLVEPPGVPVERLLARLERFTRVAGGFTQTEREPRPAHRPATTPAGSAPVLAPIEAPAPLPSTILASPTGRAPAATTSHAPPRRSPAGRGNAAATPHPDLSPPPSPDGVRSSGSASAGGTGSTGSSVAALLAFSALALAGFLARHRPSLPSWRSLMVPVPLERPG